MGISGFTSLSIDQIKYKKIRSTFDRIVKSDTEKSFTQWATKVIESNLAKSIYLKKTFPDLSVIKAIDNGLVIEDLKNNIIAKVTINDNKMICSHKGKEAESYMLYTTLHPEFHIL